MKTAEQGKGRQFGIDAATGRLMIAGKGIPMPKSRLGRVALGSGLMAGGLLGFLPILGFWMLPLGFVILAEDIPLVRRQKRRIGIWWEKRRRRRG